MKRTTVPTIVITLVALLLITGLAVAAPADKVYVCHSQGNGAYRLININLNALPAHVGHGDGLPGDPVPGMPGKVFADDCAVIDAATAIYDSIPLVYPGSFTSLGYEATSTDEFGDHVAFAGSARDLLSVDVGLTNWSCENDFDYIAGAWVPNRAGTDACVSAPGSFFTHPITLNIYEVDVTSGNPEPGALLGSLTDTFDIPFRPSWDSVNCTGAGETPATDEPFGGRWYDPVLGACVHGFAFNISFDFSALSLTLPDEVIFGVAYDTAHYGASPLVTNGPYNSLNVSVTADPPLIGTDVEPDTAFWDTSYGPFYCDSGAGGTDTFRRDAGCWAPYTPVIRFNAQ